MCSTLILFQQYNVFSQPCKEAANWTQRTDPEDNNKNALAVGFQSNQSGFAECNRKQLILCSMCLFFNSFTCECWINAGEIQVALQFDLVQDIHLLLCRQRPIEPLPSQANHQSTCQKKEEEYIKKEIFF